ncbi:PD-(D/E)XK nuclease-like domain-containing protein [Aeromonas caviae]|uniref:PD-(D/E)XK nuclease-like domain-containing protein n=1 Tax=Aeromonas caviae TaxID=648 RepID=UPI0029DCAF77|nr:PD-(D/E)XK nuclease-like domain-containing protein [Aeromonas caviae]MDX7835529.1 PD-(D/E)XK nuclease-like domain-containing protein [Aeromonas caviae]
MNAFADTSAAHPLGRVFGLSNEEYHAGPGVSKSQLDQIAESPATYIWAKNAPVDEEKLKAFDMGSAIHCLLLEPDEFKDRFIIAPPFNRRTNAGKEAEAEFLANCAELGKTVMDAEEGRKLYLMRDSVMAHPDARWLLEQEGHSEASFYWIDPETQELCRIRPDRHLSNHPIMIDVKSVDDMGRFERHVEDFRYHVQDAMYSEGFHRVMGEEPEFVFLAVSTSVNCGRYPVRVRPLTDDWKDAGKDLFRRDLHRFHDCRVNNDWHDFKPLQRPAWATRKAA